MSNETLHLVEGGLVLLLEAVKAGDPQREIIWRIEEELRLIRRDMSPRVLSKGSVYETSMGPAEYLGLDTYHGETTHMFGLAGERRYILPAALASFLKPKTPALLPQNGKVE